MIDDSYDGPFTTRIPLESNEFVAPTFPLNERKSLRSMVLRGLLRLCHTGGHDVFPASSVPECRPSGGCLHFLTSFDMSVNDMFVPTTLPSCSNILSGMLCMPSCR